MNDNNDTFITDRAITELEPPHVKFESQYGYLTYAAWCQREIARFWRSGIATEIHTHRSGDICLVRDPSRDICLVQD